MRFNTRFFCLSRTFLGLKRENWPIPKQHTCFQEQGRRIPKRFGIFVDNGLCKRTMPLSGPTKSCLAATTHATTSLSEQDAQRRDDGNTIREGSSCDFAYRCRRQFVSGVAG